MEQGLENLEMSIHWMLPCKTSHACHVSLRRLVLTASTLLYLYTYTHHAYLLHSKGENCLLLTHVADWIHTIQALTHGM